MIIKPTRRELFSYGGGALLASRVLAQQPKILKPWLRTADGPGIPPPAIISFINGAGGSTSDNNSAATTPVDTTGGNFLIVAVGVFSAVPTAAHLTDTYLNTWTPLTVQQNSNLQANLFYCASATVGAGHVFTYSDAGTFPGIVGAAFSNVNAAPFDSQTGANTLATGPITPSQNGELVISMCTSQNTGAGNQPTACTGCTIIAIVPCVSSRGVALAYVVQTTAAAVTPTWDQSSGPANKAACFKAA